VKVALYKGKSAVSLAIRFLTRGQYSHAALLFDAQASLAASQAFSAGALDPRYRNWHEGAAVEAWSGGVRNPPSFGTLHTPGTPVDVFRFSEPLSPEEESRFVAEAGKLVGAPYDYRDVLRFVSRLPGKVDGRWFCSMAAAYVCAKAGRPLFRRTQPWEVPPHWLARSLALEFDCHLYSTRESWR